MRTAMVALLVVGLALAAPVQTAHGSDGKLEAVLLDPARPGTYIAFERIGRRVSDLDGRREDGVFLKIHNNTRWKLLFTVLGDVPKLNGDADLVYEVVEDPDGYPPSSMPIGNSFDVVGELWLRPAKSVLFSVPKEVVGEGLGIEIRFRYEWEVNNGREPRHSLVFFHSDLPATLRKGEKRRPRFGEVQGFGRPPAPLASPLPKALSVPDTPNAPAKRKDGEAPPP